mmetsp:Transcript_9417/g.11903  ORF Transcript_9417/g.11903 Transcript_9417/m.11903 type:complete len:1448 (-) Transcript_9417:1876-6219(-)
MRKSKSNPSKYAKGYRKISQRRMTLYEEGNEDKEIEKLKELLRTSSDHLSKHDQNHFGVDDNDKEQEKGAGKETDDVEDKERENKKFIEDSQNIISKEEDAIEEGEESTPQYTTDGTELMLPSRKKKKNSSKKSFVELTPEELKAAKNKHKAMQRKLLQIETRHEKKRKRSELYQTLSDHALSEMEMALLGKSSELGKRLSKKEMLRKILQRERAGIDLTDEERNLLYIERGVEEEMQIDNEKGISSHDKMSTIGNEINIPVDSSNDVAVIPLEFPSSGNKRKKPKKKKSKSSIDGNNHDKDGSNEEKKLHRHEDDTSKMESGKSVLSTNEEENNIMIKDRKKNISVREKVDEGLNSTETNIKPNISFAEQMMTGLSSLKTKAAEDKEERDKKEAEAEEVRAGQRRIEEEEERKKRPYYVPSNPTIVMSAAAMGLKPNKKGGVDKNSWRILPVNRPEEIQATRYDLPVSSMEYEIVDSIRNHNVTILCSETGSGKSTQVPQFLYESGLTLGNATSEGEDDGLLICVTQPRRVAAVSTAKRVCYEMGHSKDKGQSIRGGKNREGNLVSYQTKYESAGVGTKTRLKFMTDGILLQEIKSDLLLRKYGAIVLDEAHERNLNTDVLLGLLSAALPLRQKAFLEGSLPPLKLIIMSATLRIEDFTANGKLFLQDPPNVVKVPGRTFPVTIHHNKTTELDDYERIAFQKVCKIHRKLPPGGILVFLTGKQEIIRMNNRLRRALGPKTERRETALSSDSLDVEICPDDETGGFDSGLRDMDDDEADGDLYQRKDSDDALAEGDEENDGIDKTALEAKEAGETEDNIPKKVMILPLYSLLSVTEQAKVFAPIDEDTRMIVVATNIAETSLTIPGISYVVDTGRQKCRNYHAGTGVASYDVMWISKASADQRAGRAGRTGPGHCYRIFSSSVYSRHLDPFALPEVLTRPLEDVVLAMKAMGIGNVGAFPFPTSPDSSHLNAATKLLASIGCVDISNVERDGGDGKITPLGTAISKLPIGVRYGKMLLVAAQGNVLDYGIVMVSVLSESNLFSNSNAETLDDNASDEDSLEGLDEVDRHNAMKQEEIKRKESRNRWSHRGGDVMAGILASGAFSYAGGGAGGASEGLASKRFCEENGLNLVVMSRIQKMRVHLARLAHQRLGNATGIAAQSGKILSSMAPPKTFQENLLRQAVVSGFLDNVARRSPQGRFGNETNVPRTAYFSCRSSISEPLFMDRKSVLFSRDPRQLPEWVCYDSLIRKTTKKGDTISMMTNVTPIDPSWLGTLADGSQLLMLGDPINIPQPMYDADKDAVLCSVSTKYGDQGWILPPLQIEMKKVLQESGSKQNLGIMQDDPYRWFLRNLLEGKVLSEVKNVSTMLNDDPAIITRRKPLSKVGLIVSALSNADIDSKDGLIKYWAEKDDKFLFRQLKSWIKKDKISDFKKLWIDTVKKRIKEHEY